MASPAKLYTRIWRWHFFAGLLCAPVLFIVSVTGAIYVYQPDWEPSWAPNLFLSPGAPEVGFVDANLNGLGLERALSRQLNAAQKAASDTLGREQVGSPPKPEAVVIPGLAGRSNIFLFKDRNSGQTKEVFVNPLTEVVQGSRIREKAFFPRVLQLHRDLMLGLPGRFLVELATSWAMILVITGIYLWWPRGSRRGRGVYWLRLGKNFRVFNRDLHAVSGFYFSVLILILVLTGLVYSPILGTVIKKPIVAADSTTQKIFKRVDSKPGSGPAVKLSQVARHIDTDLLAGNTTVLFAPRRPNTASKPGDSFMVMHRPGPGFAGGQMVFVDQTSGELIERVALSHAKPLTRVLFEVYPIHIGAVFGETSKLIAFITCIILAVAAVGGVLMWWLRRPQGRWGFPPRAKERGLLVWIQVTIICLGILFPMVGLTILVIWAVGRFRKLRS